MADTEIEKWSQRGLISLWHYDGFPKNYCGYHLTADPEGCVFLLGLIERFKNAQYPARKKIVLAAPTPEILSVPNCSRRAIPAESIELRFRREHADEHWSVTEGNGKVLVEMGVKGLRDLERGVFDITEGNGDWSTGSATSSLWFWWHPNYLRRTRHPTE